MSTHGSKIKNLDPEQIRNLRFGALNSITRPSGQRERKTAGVNFMDAVYNSADRQFNVNALSNMGPYKAVVLRVEKNSGNAIAGSWLNNIIAMNTQEVPPLVRIKARIPEIHSGIPIPDNKGSEDGPHQKIIDFYPTYEAVSSDLPEPQEGDIIYVDYGNKNTLSDPVYVKPLGGITSGAGAGGAFSGKGVHGCVGGLQATAPPADPLAGQNQVAQQEGFALAPRQAAAVESGEFKMMSGEKGGYPPTISSWENAITKLKIPGKSWIGYLEGNDTTAFGTGDSEHKSEDELRDTIIFVPNITDVSYKSAKVEVIIFFHDLAEFNQMSFDNIASAAKELALEGRNFVLVMPELPWSTNTNTPNGRTDEGMDEYEDWWDDVLEKLTEITGALFEDSTKNKIGRASCRERV